MSLNNRIYVDKKADEPQIVSPTTDDASEDNVQSYKANLQTSKKFVGSETHKIDNFLSH